ncbi:MAG: hypothetical protein HOH43_24895 [Candidatus Latescibacteria bacterium]|jgi:hypothetical protein|nr:hypothetical protein [Candidatus Latescibacterota bacterium]
MTALQVETGISRYLRFVIVVCLAHVFTYLVAGTITYELIYKSAIEAGGFDAFMRSPNNPEEWRHVETWLFPAQALRGILFGLALCPLVRTLAAWSFTARSLTLLGLLLVFSVWSVTMPGPGSIEGWLYLRPGSGPQLPNPILGYIEVPSQLAFFSMLVSWRIGRFRKQDQAA